VLSGNIKFGSLGEYETKEINNKIPENEINMPQISTNLLPVKINIELVIFLIFIIDESNLSLCII